MSDLEKLREALAECDPECPSTAWDRVWDWIISQHPKTDTVWLMAISYRSRDPEVAELREALREWVGCTEDVANQYRGRATGNHAWCAWNDMPVPPWVNRDRCEIEFRRRVQKGAQ